QHEIPFDKILVATGRRPNTENLNLSAANVNTSRHGHVRVDHFLRTSNPQIYAAGDVTGILPVLNLATYHGEQAGRNVALSTPIPVKERFVPIAIFTEPEYARVGLSETEARNRKIPVHAGRISFADLGKAIVNRQTEGGLKIVAHAKSREILGAEIFGTGASDLIHTLTVAMHFHATIDQYQEILHIHPTFSEIFKYLIDEMTESL
ncbi:MAG: FAD-dependent oxidoreductase, partial [Leptospirales bacterium]